MAFWSVSKDSSTGETAGSVLDGPSAMPCRRMKTGVVSQVPVIPGRAVAAEAGSALAARGSRAAMARMGSINLVDLCLFWVVVTVFLLFWFRCSDGLPAT